MRYCALALLVFSAACFDFSPVKIGVLDGYCREDGSCDGDLQCDTNNRCNQACGTLICAPWGRCEHDANTAYCVCSEGLTDAAGNCIGDCSSGVVDGAGICVPPCEPVAHATVSCADGDVYSFDSCGQRESIVADCGARGCSDATCGRIVLGALADSARGWAYEHLPFTVSDESIPYVIAIEPIWGETYQRFVMLRFVDGAWENLRGNAGLQMFTAGVQYPVVSLDSAGTLSFAFCEGLPNIAECNVKVSRLLDGQLINYSPTPLSEGMNGRIALISGPDGLTAAWAHRDGATFDTLIRAWDGASWNDIPFPYQLGEPSLALIGGDLAVGATYSTASVRIRSSGSWMSLGGGQGGAESLLAPGFDASSVALAESAGIPVVALRVRADGSDIHTVHARQFVDGGWKRLGDALEPGAIDSTWDVRQVRIAAGPRGEVAIAFTQLDANGVSKLFLRIWKDGAWTALRYDEVDGDALTLPTHYVDWFDLRIGGERMCIGWTAHMTGASTALQSALLCAWL